MYNPFFNTDESRVRAGIRITVYLIISIVLMSIGNSLPLDGWQYGITAALSFGYFWLSFRFTDRRDSISAAGLSLHSDWWLDVGKGMLIAFVAMAGIFLIQLASGNLTVIRFGWEYKSSTFWMDPILLLFYQMVFVGFYEEWMSRSYLIVNMKEGFSGTWMRPEWATLVAVFCSSAIFGFLHAPNPNVTWLALVHILMAGVMLAIPYVVTGSLAQSVGLHIMWNFAQGGIFGFRVSGLSFRNSLINIQQDGAEWWTGGSFGPEGGISGLLGILGIMGFYLLWYYKKGNLRLHPYFKKNYQQNHMEP